MGKVLVFKNNIISNEVIIACLKTIGHMKNVTSNVFI